MIRPRHRSQCSFLDIQRGATSSRGLPELRRQPTALPTRTRRRFAPSSSSGMRCSSNAAVLSKPLDAALAAACSAAVQASRPECAEFSAPRPVFLLAFLPPGAEFSARSLRWFSRRPDHFGGLAVADLRLRGLDQRRDPPTAATPVRGPARRPCAAGRARRRGRAPAARPRLSGMSSASIRRRRPPRLSAVVQNDWRGIPI